MSAGFKHPRDADGYRQRTQEMNMHGVTLQRFKCRKCGKSKLADGRKRVSSHARDGYMCAECAGVAK